MLKTTGSGPRGPDPGSGSGGHRGLTRYAGTSAVTVAFSHGGGHSRPFGQVLAYSTFGMSLTTEPAAVVTLTNTCLRFNRAEMDLGSGVSPDGEQVPRTDLKCGRLRDLAQMPVHG